MATNLAIRAGRRKTAIARAFLRDGNGKITINGKDIEIYFHRLGLADVVRKPFLVTDLLGKYDVLLRVTGGGFTGQADACKLAIARCLLTIDSTNREVLKANGLLTRDSRMVERKKFGQKSARKKFQFSKR